MATYFVHKGASPGGDTPTNGTTGSPWHSITYALSRMSPDDVLKIRAGATPYYEQFTISLAGVTLEADTGHAPIIDGKYSPDEGTFQSNNFVVPNGQNPTGETRDWVFQGQNSALIRITAKNVVLRNLTICNCAGRALSLSRSSTNDASGALIDSCHIDFTYDSAVAIEGRSNSILIEDVVIQNCLITRSSMRKFDPTRGGIGQGPESVATTYHPVRGKNCKLLNSIIAFCGGEGAAVSKASQGTVIDGNVIFDNYHWHLGVQCGRFGVMTNNFVFHTGRREYMLFKDGTWQTADGLVIGDEDNSSEIYNPGHSTTIYNNIIVNMKRGFEVRANATKNYTRTRVYNTYVGFNTIVHYGVNTTKTAVEIKNNGTLGSHYNNLFENNIVWTPRQSDIFTGSTTGFTFRNNAFRFAPGMGGTNNFIEGDKKIWPTVPPAPTTAEVPFTINATAAALKAAMPTYAQLRAMAERYRIPVNSGAKDAGSDGSTVSDGTNRYTPPVAPRQRDFFNARRDAFPDIGAHENGGVVTPGVTASFSQSASPAFNQSVTFTDTSTYFGGAAFSSRAWTVTKPNAATQTGTGETISVTFDQTGTWTVALAVTPSAGSANTSTRSYSISSSVTASYTYTPAGTTFAQGSATAVKTFTNTTSPNLATTTYLWTLTKPDSSTVTATTRNWSYTFADVGAHTLTLRATPAGGTANTTPAQTFTVTAPNTPDTIDASFTATPSSGQAPLTVVFANTTTTGGGAVDDAWSWSFGDGNTSTVEAPTHIYQNAGTYTVTFTARDSTLGLSDTATTTITVTAPPPPPAGGDVVVRQTRTALNTSTGTQSITIAEWVTNKIVPKAVEIIVTAATADNTAANGELMSVGYAASGSGQVVAAVASDHNVADVNSARRWTDDAVILTIDGGGTQTGRAVVQSWDEGGITLNITDAFPAAYLATFVFRAGTEYTAWVGTAEMGAAYSKTTVNVGFEANVAHFAATWGARDTSLTDLELSLGMAARESATQAVVERWVVDGATDVNNQMRVFTDAVAHSRYNARKNASVKVREWTTTGLVLVTTNDEINSSVLILAERFATTGVAQAAISTGTAATAVDYSTTWNPQFVKLLVSPATVTGTYSDTPNAGTIGIHTVTTDGEFSNTVSGKNASATTDEQSLSDNALNVPTDAGAILAAGTTALGTGKYTITYTTAPGTARLWPALALQVGQAVAPPDKNISVDFAADVVSGFTPLEVAFTDLSSASNTTVTTWLWEFGDDSTSTEQNPTHTYQAAGTYSVSLTASDGAGTSGTRTKTNWIIVENKAKRVIIVGPFVAKPVTETSDSITRYLDVDDDFAERGTIEMKLSLNYVPLAGDGQEPDIETDEVALYQQGTETKIKLMDGTIKTITVS